MTAFEGALLHVATRLLRQRETQIESMLVELGGDANNTSHPPRGYIDDVFTLRDELGYDVYRVNIHTGREIFDWRGINVNRRTRPPSPLWEPLFGLRAIRKLEWLKPSVSRAHDTPSAPL